MSETAVSIRNIKETLTALFSKDAESLEALLTAVCHMPLRKVASALFPFFYSREPLLFWRAVTAMGAVVSLMAEENAEWARDIMRRLMWNLNDESGGIGWGSAEAMGEIMARSDPMAAEYACILISYINPCANFMDNPALQKGVLWAIGRLAQDRPHRVQGASEFLTPFLASADSVLRGLAARAAAALADERTKSLLIGLYSDNKNISLYENGKLSEVTIGSLAQSHP